MLAAWFYLGLRYEKHYKHEYMGGDTKSGMIPDKRHNLLVAPDEKCAEQYEKAERQEGVEGQEALNRIYKRCGRVMQPERAILFIRHGELFNLYARDAIPFNGETGWVHRRFLVDPEAKAQERVTVKGTQTGDILQMLFGIHAKHVGMFGT